VRAELHCVVEEWSTGGGMGRAGGSQLLLQAVVNATAGTYTAAEQAAGVLLFHFVCEPENKRLESRRFGKAC